MNKKKVVLYIFLIFALLCTSVYATISGDIKLSIEEDTINAGDEFNVTLSIKDITLKNGIDSVEGYINIDENVIEELTLDSIVVNEDEKVIIGENILGIYNSNTADVLPSTGIFFNDNPVSDKGDYRLVINMAKAVPNGTDLVTLTFKVKSGVDADTYENAISYDLFVLFNEDVDKTDKISQSLDLVVTEKNGNTVNNVVNNTVKNEIKNNTVNNTVKNEIKNNTVNNAVKNNTVNNTVKNTIKNNTVNNTVKNTIKNNTVKNTIKNTITIGNNGNIDNTVSKDSLPDTGFRFILIPIIVIAVCGIVFYSKYNKYNNI